MVELSPIREQLILKNTAALGIARQLVEEVFEKLLGSFSDCSADTSAESEPGLSPLKPMLA